MTLFWFRLLALGSLLAWLSPSATLAQESTASPTPEVPPPPEVSQPAYEVFRVDDNGIGRAYRVWEEWVPEIVTTPDGGAWVFFTAQIRSQDGNTESPPLRFPVRSRATSLAAGTCHGLRHHPVRRIGRGR